MPRCGCHGKPAAYSSGLSLRKSSSNRNGSNSCVSPKPKARRRCTPAPSIVGCDSMIFFTGRIDMISHLSGPALERATVLSSRLRFDSASCFRGRAKLGHQRGKLIEEGFQETPGALIGNDVIGVDKAGLELQIGFAAGQDNALRPEDLPQMLLGQRRADRALRRAGDGHDLAGPGVLAPGPRTPV